MTPDELREQKKNVMFDHHEAEQELEGLRSKAYKRAELIEEVARMLRRSPSGELCEQNQAHHGFNIIITSQQFKDAMDVKTLLELADHLRASSKKVSELSEQKKRLGL